MPLIHGDLLPRRFRKCLVQAELVDIAVAWVTPCDTLDAVAENAEAGTPTRMVVGLSGNVTDPTTLRRLHGHPGIELRVVPPVSRGLFHPQILLV